MCDELYIEMIARCLILIFLWMIWYSSVPCMWPCEASFNFYWRIVLNEIPLCSVRNTVIVRGRMIPWSRLTTQPNTCNILCMKMFLFFYHVLVTDIVGGNVSPVFLDGGKAKSKGKAGIAVHGTPSHSCGVSLAIMGSHSVSCHTTQVNTGIAFTPASQAGTRFTYPGGMEGWVDLGDLLHTEMVYTPADGHPSKYWPGPVSINFVDQANAANHYTTMVRKFLTIVAD